MIVKTVSFDSLLSLLFADITHMGWRENSADNCAFLFEHRIDEENRYNIANDRESPITFSAIT